MDLELVARCSEALGRRTAADASLPDEGLARAKRVGGCIGGARHAKDSSGVGGLSPKEDTREAKAALPLKCRIVAGARDRAVLSDVESSQLVDGGRGDGCHGAHVHVGCLGPDGELCAGEVCARQAPEGVRRELRSLASKCRRRIVGLIASRVFITYVSRRSDQGEVAPPTIVAICRTPSMPWPVGRGAWKGHYGEIAEGAANPSCVLQEASESVDT